MNIKKWFAAKKGKNGVWVIWPKEFEHKTGFADGFGIPDADGKLSLALYCGEAPPIFIELLAGEWGWANQVE